MAELGKSMEETAVRESAWVKQMRDKVRMYGGVLDPHACFLLERGLKTLGLRVRAQNQTAARLAAFLHRHPQAPPSPALLLPALPFPLVALRIRVRECVRLQRERARGCVSGEGGGACREGLSW